MSGQRPTRTPTPEEFQAGLERLQLLGVQCTGRIQANPGEWKASAGWFLSLSLGHGPEDVPAGAWSRRISAAWPAATANLRQVARRLIFGMQDARRIVFLAALTYDPDFDGKELGLEWGFNDPQGKDLHEAKVQVQYDMPPSIGGHAAMHDIIGRAFRHLDAHRLGQSRGRTPTAHSVPTDASKAGEDTGRKSYQFVKKGKIRTMVFESESGDLPDCVGFQRIHRLLEKQGREVAVAELFNGGRLFGGDEALEPPASPSIPARAPARGSTKS